MSTAVAPLQLEIPLTIAPRSFVAHWAGGIVQATSAGTSTRVRRWPLTADEPCELLTSELNHIVGFTGPLVPGAPGALPPADAALVDQAFDAQIAWGSPAVIRGSVEQGIAVLEVLGIDAAIWHRIGESAWVATSPDGMLAAVAVAASPESVEEITIVFDPTADVQVENNDAWISLHFEGDEDSEDDEEDAEDDDHESWQDIHVGDFSADKWHVSIGCRTENPSLEMPDPTGAITEPLKLRTAAAGGVVSGHARIGEDVICVARFRDAPEGEWLEFGDSGVVICRGEGDILSGFAHRQRFVEDHGQPIRYTPVDEIDMSGDPVSTDDADSQHRSMANIFVQTADGSSVPWQEPAPDELFTRATDIAFTPLGAAPDWNVGPGRIITANAYWQVDGPASSIQIQHGHEHSGPLVRLTSSRVDEPPTLRPQLAPEPLRHKAVAWIVQQDVPPPASKSDPDAWRMPDQARLLRNELSMRIPRSVEVPMRDSPPILLEVLEGKCAWGAWGEHDGVQILVTAREVPIESMQLLRLADLEVLRGATLACVEPPDIPFGPSPDAHRMSEEGLWALNAAEDVAGSLEAWWTAPPGQNDIVRFFAPEVVARWGGVEQLRERLLLYRAVSGGLGVRAVAVESKATPDGLLASGTVVIVRPDADSDPAGTDLGSVFSSDHASQLEYDADHSNDVHTDGAHVEVRLRFRKDGTRLLLTTDLPSLLEDVYGSPDKAIRPSLWARPAAAPHHRIEVEPLEITSLADADLHPRAGIASISRTDETVVTVNGELHPIADVERLWQIRWVDSERLAISGHAGEDCADTFIYDVPSRKLVGALDRGPRADGLAASPRFVATTYCYDDEPGVPHASEQPAEVRDPSSRRPAIPSGPIGEGLAAFTIDGEYQLGLSSHFGGNDEVDDFYAPPMVFTSETTLVLFADEAVVELDLEHGTRTLHPRPEVGYRHAIAARGEWLFVLAGVDDEGDDVTVWEWRLGDEWPTPIGTVARSRPLDGHGTSDGTFVSRRRSEGAGEIIRVVPID